MMGDTGDVLDAFLLLLASEPQDHPVVLGVAEGGQELRAGWRQDRVGAAECESVFVEVPEVPRGSMTVVLCRWNDDNETLAYAALRGGADLPRWKLLQLTDEGVRLCVQWPGEVAPHVYDFRWLPTVARPPHPH